MRRGNQREIEVLFAKYRKEILFKKKILLNQSLGVYLAEDTNMISVKNLKSCLNYNFIILVIMIRDKLSSAVTFKKTKKTKNHQKKK